MSQLRRGCGCSLRATRRDSAALRTRVRHVGLLLHGHHRDGRVDAGRQRDLDLVLVPVHADAHALLHVRRGHFVAQAHDELGDVLHVDDVLRARRQRGGSASPGDASKASPWRRRRPGGSERTRPFTLASVVPGLMILVQRATCSGCSSCIICLSDTRSHRLGGTSPVSATSRGGA